MINYFKYTSGNAFTLSGVDYSGFVNIDDNKPFTGRIKDSFSVELSSKDNFLSRSILEKREFDNSPTAFSTNKVKSLEYSPRNVLSNDFLKKNFNILYKNNLSLYSLGQVYNNSFLDTTNFKDEQAFGGFFGLSSTTTDIRNDDNKASKNLNTPYQIDPFKNADESRFPGISALDDTKKAYVETFEDGFLYTITTDSETIAFSGCFSGQLEKINNAAVQSELANVTKLNVDKANGLIYCPKVESDGLTYTDIYDRDIFRSCARLKLVDRIKTSEFRVINNNISFGKNYKVVQVIDNENSIKLEISPTTTTEILATLPISRLDNPEYVKVEARYTDDLLLIIVKPLSNTQIYNAYFIDISEFILNGIIPEPIIVPRAKFKTTYKPTKNENSAVTVFGRSPLPEDGNDAIPLVTGYWGPLFRNKFAASEFSLATPRERIVSIDSDGDGIYETNEIFYESDLINFYGEDPVNDRPDGLFIYRGDDSIPDLDVSFSDYDSNLFSLKDNGNMTERMVTNPVPVISFFNSQDLLLPPDIYFNSPYKFNTNNWKFNTNSLKSNQISALNLLTDTFKDKTYAYFHNIGRIYYSTDPFNKKRISLVSADLESFFNPDIFNTICESGLGINLNVLIQDILRDTINIYNNFTRIPKAGELLSYYINETEVSREEYERFQNLSREEQLQGYGDRVIVPATQTLAILPELGVTSSTKTVPSTLEVSKPAVSSPPVGESYYGFVASIDSPSAILLPNQYGSSYKSVGATGQFTPNPGFGFDERQLNRILNTPEVNENQKFYITVSDYPTARRSSTGSRNIAIDAKDLFPFPGDLEQTEYGRIEVNAEELQEFLDGNFPGQMLPNGTQSNPFDRTQRFNNLRERVGPTYYYINEQQVSRVEYEAFQNLSQEEQLNRYGIPKPQVVSSAQPDNRTVSSRVENTGIKVFSDYKIPTPLEIDTRNFYFHSNESVNYLSINRVFSKLFELQKTIYDSILSS